SPLPLPAASYLFPYTALLRSSVGVTAFASDADATTNTVSYALTNNAGGRFAINASTGVVTVAGAIDREVDGPSLSITVRATSADGSTADQSFTIAVNDVDETPTITSGASFSVPENTTAVTTVTATDPDSSAPFNTLTFSISGGADAAKFSITSGGVLTFVSAPNFESPTDVGGDNVYDVVVKVTDGGGLFDTKALAITVTN